MQLLAQDDAIWDGILASDGADGGDGGDGGDRDPGKGPKADSDDDRGGIRTR